MQLNPATAYGSAEIAAGGVLRGGWETSPRLVDCHPACGLARVRMERYREAKTAIRLLAGFPSPSPST